MKNSEKFVIIPGANASYDDYLDIFKEASIANKMIPRGNIIFPFPSSFEEYEIIAEIKAKILYYLFEQYWMYKKIEIKQLILFSLDLTENMKKLYSWERLEPSDYSLMLFSDDFVSDVFGIYSPMPQVHFKKMKSDMLLYFDKSNPRHIESFYEVYNIENNYEGDRIIDGKTLSSIKIPSSRIIAISW